MLVLPRGRLELSGGPYCGSTVADVGMRGYAVGAVAAIPGASPGTPGIVTLHQWSPQPVPGVSEQSLYFKRMKNGRSWYAHVSDLDLDAA